MLGKRTRFRTVPGHMDDLKIHGRPWTSNVTVPESRLKICLPYKIARYSDFLVNKMIVGSILYANEGKHNELDTRIRLI